MAATAIILFEYLKGLKLTLSPIPISSQSFRPTNSLLINIEIIPCVPSYYQLPHFPHLSDNSLSLILGLVKHVRCPGPYSVRSTSYRGQQLRGNTSACTGKSGTRECICIPVRPTRQPAVHRRHRQAAPYPATTTATTTLQVQWGSRCGSERIGKVLPVIRHRLILIANYVVSVNNSDVIQN